MRAAEIGVSIASPPTSETSRLRLYIDTGLALEGGWEIPLIF